MSSVTCLEYHPYGEFLLSGSVDTNFKLWDLRTKKCIVTYKGHTKKLTAVKFCPDGTLCAASGEDGLLTLWDLRKKEVREGERESRAVARRTMRRRGRRGAGIRYIPRELP